jgi:hypothetical protein
MNYKGKKCRVCGGTYKTPQYKEGICSRSCYLIAWNNYYIKLRKKISDLNKEVFG